MKNLTLILCSLLCSSILFSQKIITVADQTIRVGAMKTEEMHFAFAAGDKIIFNFLEADKKKLTELEILEYPYNSKFAAFETGEVENKTLPVTTTGVYKFRLYNDAVSDRECKIKIQRIPASDETEAFNTKVVWQAQHDTGYYTVQEQQVQQEYVSQQIIPLTASYTENGSTALFPGARIVFPIQLPENTVEWYYQVSVFADKQEQTNQFFNLAGEINSLIVQTGGLKFGPDLLTQQPGEEYCDIYIMDGVNATRFEAMNDYKYSLIGSNEHIKSGIIKVQGGSSLPLYLGINNPDSEKQVHVILKCVAIVSKEKLVDRDVEKMTVASKMVPVLKVEDISWVH